MNKKQLLETALTLAFSVSLTTGVQAACNGGHIVGGVDGSTYCMSDFTMTWWSAFSWCTAQGGDSHLAEWNEACGSAGIGSSCPNLNHKDNPTVPFPDKFRGSDGKPKDIYVWIAQPHNTNASSAYYVILSSGGVNGTHRYSLNGDYCYALCK